MIHTMDTLLETLLVKTNQLAQMVEDKKSDPDKWMQILDDREQIINNVSGLLQEGSVLSLSHKQLLAEMQEINLRIMPQMDLRREAIKKKLSSFQQKKMAKQFYNKSGPNGYGAFFDRKN